MKILTPVIFALLLVAACKKYTTATFTELNGQYSGVLIANQKNSGDSTLRTTSPVSVFFLNHRYRSISRPDSVAAGAAGNFQLQGNNITLKDSLSHLANFDWNLILKGTYNYTILGDSLVLTKRVAGTLYTYRLGKN